MKAGEGPRKNTRRDCPEADARVLGRILAAQNILFSLPDITRIAEFHAQTLISIPGISGCRVCLGSGSVHAGDFETGDCSECATLRRLARGDDGPAPAPSSLKCSLADQPGMRVIAIDSYQHHFGFVVLKVEETAAAGVYGPFVGNLTNYVALILENRWQKESLQRAHDGLERQVEERTRELTAANEALNALHHAAMEMMQEAIEARRRAEQSRNMLQLIIESIPVRVFWKDRGHRFLGCNTLFACDAGYSRPDELLGLDDFAMGWPEQAELYRADDRKVMESGLPTMNIVEPQTTPSGARIWLSTSKVPLRNPDGDVFGVLGVYEDITERKRAENIRDARLRLLEFASSHSMDEVLTATLDEIEALTGSSVGFYHFVEADQKTLSLQNWSTNTLKTMCTAEGKGSHYDISRAGVWVDCVHERRPVVHNDYASLPHRKGFPEGHVPVIREAVVPIFRGSLIKAIIGVGNKPSEYDESDIQILSQLGDLSLDIAERKQAEEALAEKSQFIDSLLRAIPVAVFYKDREGRYLGCNDAFTEIMGVAAEEIRGKTVHELWPGELSQKYHEMDLDLIRKREHQVYEFLVKAKDGRLHPVIFAKDTYLNKNGEIAGLVGAFLDITERKQAEESLRRSEWRKTILNRITTIFLTIPDDKMYGEVLEVILQVLKSELGVFGFIADNGDLVIPSLTKGVWKECQVSDKSTIFPCSSWGDSLWGKAIRDRKAFRSDGPFRTPKGHLPIRSFLTVPIVFGDETIALLSVANGERSYTAEDEDLLEGIARSISPILNARLQRDREEKERKRAETELKEYRDHLEELVRLRTDELAMAKDHAEAANQAKSAFLANMSHELRSPLNIILGFTQLMERDPSISQANRETLSLIGRSGEHLLTLINDVLEMSRIEAGHSGLRIQGFDLFETLLGVEEMKRSRALAKGLELTVQIAPDVPRFIATDEAKLRQVLLNLIGNAIKFTTEGRVILRVSNGSEDRGEQKAGPVAVRLLFEVEDTGVGIAPEQARRIFDPFVQAREGQPIKEGAGLGLAISRKYVQLMGGKIRVASTLHKGSVFSFDVLADLVGPTDVVAREQSAHRVIGLAPGTPPYRILVVEDMEVSRLLLRSLLESVGFQVREAANGQEAIEAFEQWKPDLIWMDMLMPVMDGYEATRRIKASNRERRTTIISISASSFEEEKELALSSGCDDFVRKPFKEADIFDAMSRHLGVQYVTDVDRTAQSTEAGGHAEQAPVTAGDLSGLSSGLLASLESAAESLKFMDVQDVIERIRTVDPDLGSRLAHLAKEFRYDLILAAIQHAHPQSREGGRETGSQKE